MTSPCIVAGPCVAFPPASLGGEPLAALLAAASRLSAGGASGASQLYLEGPRDTPHPIRIGVAFLKPKGRDTAAPRAERFSTWRPPAVHTWRKGQVGISSLGVRGQCPLP